MPAGISCAEGVFHSDSYFINPHSGFISLKKALPKKCFFVSFMYKKDIFTFLVERFEASQTSEVFGCAKV